MADELLLSPAGKLAKAHYDAHAGDGRASIVVPEWGGEADAPLVIYWRPFTLGDQARAFSGEHNAVKDDVRAHALVVYHKAEDRDGKRMFAEVADLHVLQYVADRTIVDRIAAEIMRAPGVSELVAKLRDSDLRMTMFALADHLKKTIAEIEQMTVAEFHETLAFYRLKKEKEDQNSP